MTLPVLTDVSLRQARSILEGLGVMNITVKEVPSEYRGLVLAVMHDGVRLMPGTRIPVTTHVTLEVGAGYSEAEADSIFADSLAEPTFEEEL